MRIFLKTNSKKLLDKMLQTAYFGTVFPFWPTSMMKRNRNLTEVKNFMISQETRIFLCYTRKDQPVVKQLYQKLADCGFKPWMDIQDILPGEDWQRVIKQSVREAHFFLACLSNNAVNRRGAIQVEIKEALEVWRQKLDSDIYLIPVRLEACEVPDTLVKFQWVDLFEPEGFEKLIKALKAGMERPGRIQQAQFPPQVPPYPANQLETTPNFPVKQYSGDPVAAAIQREPTLPMKPPAKRVYKPGLALEQCALIMKGGGIKGLAYVSALKELEHYYEFTWFAGTSAGAIAAVLLAAGYTTAELENILSGKNFREFLDAPFYKLPTNFIFYKGFYKANTFTVWIEKLLAAKLNSPTQVRLADLPKRVTIYASRRGQDALIFDSQDPKTKDNPAAFAVRCSMAIPFIFTPQSEAGMRVLDGGMRNNYPVDIFLRNNPNRNFIGLYLGPEVFEAEVDDSLVSDMLSIWTEATDTKALRLYREKTVIIDPRPISTTDFSITKDEKDFLLKGGRAAALKFLSQKPFPDAPAKSIVDKAYSEVDEARTKINHYRQRRKRWRLIIAALGIALVALGFQLWKGSRLLLSKKPQSPAGSFEKYYQQIPVEQYPKDFDPIFTPLQNVQQSSVEWGDYDNDGDLDVLLTGNADDTDKPAPISKIYENKTNNFEEIAVPLTPVYGGATAWGDYDNDGDLDVLLTGNASSKAGVENPIAKIYRNDNAGFFQKSYELKGVYQSAAVWGDYDNDGDLDILLTGNSGNGHEPEPFAEIYENKGNHTFERIFAGLQGVRHSSVAWGDFDKDQDLDILLTGDAGRLTQSPISKIYRNNKGSFKEFSAPLNGVVLGSAAWGDYDNDGDLDILLTGYSNGRISHIYKNRVNESKDFELLRGIGLEPVRLSAVAWGDYDNDGYLDVLLTGYWDHGRISLVYQNQRESFFLVDSLIGVNGGSIAWGDFNDDRRIDILLTGGHAQPARPISGLYKNKVRRANLTPSTPTELKSKITGNSVAISWSKSTDKETGAEALTYNLRVGTTPGGVEIVSPMAAVKTGQRRVTRFGNTDQRNGWTIKYLRPGIYYWSVQAIDNAFAGSAFAEEHFFVIEAPVSPKPAAPSNGSEVETTNLTLNWEALNEATEYYGLQVSESSNFSRIIIDQRVFSYGPYSLNYLKPGKTYYWRINAKYATGKISVWSEEWSFTTKTPAK